MAAVVFKKKLYVIGGFELKEGDLVDVGTVNAYDPATNVWSTKAMGTPRHSLAAGTVNTAAGQLRIQAVGGYSYLTSGVNGLATNEWYIP
jgi:N-acetylneuraminic acid mutarotase